MDRLSIKIIKINKYTQYNEKNLNLKYILD